MNLPDVLGLPLEEARKRLTEAGCDEFDEVLTGPPGRTVKAGVLRVVQQRTSPQGRPVLVVAKFPVLSPTEEGGGDQPAGR